MNAKTEQKERTHSAILDAAAALVRTGGIAGARVKDVMAKAGRTVGGFYAHFTSKAELVDETLRRTSRENRDRLFAKLDEKPADRRAEVVLKRYLSMRHRDDPTGGCPMPAVVGEIGTSAPEHARTLAAIVDGWAGELERHLPTSSTQSKRHQALAFIALMIGGLSLARALRGTALSDEVIKACRTLGITALDDAFERRGDAR